MTAQLQIREAERGDVELMLSFVIELAEYERAREQVHGTPELLAEALFGEHPVAEALIAELDGQAAGFAVFHSTFSTWECKAGIWLEDLYVPPRHRRRGVGEALLARIAQLALERGRARLEWAALDWNTPALAFYEKLGATRLPEWQLHRLSGAALTRVAGPM